MIAATAMLTAVAQTERADTLAGGALHVAGPNDSIDATTTRVGAPLLMPGVMLPTPSRQLTTANFDPRAIAAPFHNFRPGTATIATWTTGSLTAAGSTASFPGMAGVESGTVVFSQRMGRFTLSADAEAMKFGYFRGLRTIWGFGGSLTYDISNRVGVTVFGNYYTRSNLYQPAMLGFSPSTSFGGYVSVDLGSHWGVDVGAQSIMQQNTRNYRFEPIVTPYYKFNDKVKIGVNVGGILYNILRSNREGFRGNPTIAPPVPGHGNNHFR